MSSEFAGRIAIVTGGGNGIGKEIAIQLGRAGAHVVIVDIASDAGSAVASEIISLGGRSAARCCDVADRNAVFATFDSIRGSIGVPDILVNNAGLYGSGVLRNVTEAEWMRILNVNLSGAFWCSQAAAGDLGQGGAGRIVNIASIGGKVGWARNHAYCASKSGLIGLTKVLALELAPIGVTVNAVCPGNTDTNMMRAVDADVCTENHWPEGEFVRQVRERIPVGRLASPRDIANLVLFLCRPESSFITGQAINVDGGLIMY